MIIQIGFNKTGTSSLARYFKINGYKVIGNASVASRIHNNIIEKRLPFNGLDFDLAQDLENHKLGIYSYNYFREFHESYPQAKFILTTRSCEKWIASRLKHNGGRYVRRAMRNHSIANLSKLIDIWRKDFYSYHYSVTSYFEDKDCLFVHPLEALNVSKLVDFLGSSYSFKSTEYPTVLTGRSKTPISYDLSIPD